METGTLKELNLKPGDVVEWVDFEPIGHHTLDFIDGEFFEFATSRGPYTHHLKCTDRFRLISRASDTPKTWGEMTDAEKGESALLSGIEYIDEVFDSGLATKMRAELGVRPEPVRETVTLYVRSDKHSPGYQAVGTITLTDGKPDRDSIRMEAL